LQGCFQVAKRIAPFERAVVVTVFADSASKYLTERFWDEE
jgi:cysteine synthase